MSNECHGLYVNADGGPGYAPCPSVNGCLDGVCQCDVVCGCQYQLIVSNENNPAFTLRCEDIPPTVTTGPTTTTSTPQPTPTGTNLPCNPEQNPTRCGVRPGCVGGPRDGRECKHKSDCPGGDACVPIEKACKIDEPCFDCDVVDAQHAVRSCGVCLHCTQEEIDDRVAHPERDFSFDCCPTLPGSPIVSPVPPEKKCDNTPGYLSDCAREFDCMCRATPCEDEYDVFDTAADCAPSSEQFCGASVHAVDEHRTVEANLFCRNSLGCAGDGSVDYYTINATATVLRVYVPIMTPAPDVSVSSAVFSCPGDASAVQFTTLGSPTVDGPNFVYTIVLPTLGAYLIRFRVACGGRPACVSYKFHYSTTPPACPAAICERRTCLSSVDCDVESSCWSCDHKYGRCIEQAGCIDDICMAAGQPNDTCADTEDGALCRACTNDGCVLSRCFQSVCDITLQDAVRYDCNCVCERMCCTAADCPPVEGTSRHCDNEAGVCVYRPLPAPPTPPGPSSLGGFTASRVMSTDCTLAALDASERGYTAYAMDRFGAFDRSTGSRRPPLCGKNIEWQHIVIEPTLVATDLQAPCCAATTSWHEECIDTLTHGNETGHTWADRAWMLMHHAHVKAQQGRVAEATNQACCASLIWAAIGRECGRRGDEWQLAGTTVVRQETGPVLQAFEDGFGDGDTNDFVLHVRTVELRDADLVAVNTHTYPLARGGGFQASYGLAFGSSGAFPTHRADESTACPDREKRLAHSVLDQSATRRELDGVAKSPSGSIAVVFRHVVRSSDNTLPQRVIDAECQTVAGQGTSLCPASTAFVALYADTSVVLPREQPTLQESLESRLAFREPVVNTQSSTRYWPPRFAASAAYIPSQSGANAAARFVLRNHDCGVSILLGDGSTVASPLAITVPATAALYWRWPTEGTRLLMRATSTERTCRSGPMSGSEHCTNDAVCGGGYCNPPATKIGVPYPYAIDYYECKARGVDCTNAAHDQECCSHQVQHWYLYPMRSEELLFEPLIE